MKIRSIAAKLLVLSCLFLAVLGTRHQQADGQVLTGAGSVSLNYTVNESLAVATSPSSLTLTTTAQPITITNTYNVSSSRTALNTIQYFTSTTALSNGSNGTITNAMVLETDPYNTEHPCTESTSLIPNYQGTPISNTMCGISEEVNPNSAAGGNGNDVSSPVGHTIQLRLDPANPAVNLLPSGTYSGSLLILAVIQ